MVTQREKTKCVDSVCVDSVCASSCSIYSCNRLTAERDGLKRREQEVKNGGKREDTERWGVTVTQTADCC